MKLYIGTSGWLYNHWIGRFYPEGLKKNKWFEFYTEHFNTVEINATFYRKFKDSTFKSWYRKSPANFQFSLKAPRTITHYKRLKDIKNELKDFISQSEILKEKLGVILFQLPPGLKFDEELISEFLNEIKKYKLRFAVEVRNKTFHDERFFKLLMDNNVALCISDTANRYPSLILKVTADFVYIRLHGPTKLYASEYSYEQLKEWADRIIKWQRDSYIYFDNDYYGFAPKNAMEIKNILNELL